MRISVIFCLPLACFGCAEQSAPPKSESAARLQPAPPIGANAREDSKSPQRGMLNISEDIRKACVISESDAHFAFDSSELGAADRPVLKKLATCFTSGALAGHEVRLVGHADPRGESDYNMVLGGSRADTVKTFLVVGGIPSSRIATTSRGELDARGTDERSWAQDRRVDVMSH